MTFLDGHSGKYYLKLNFRVFNALLYVKGRLLKNFFHYFEKLKTYVPDTKHMTELLEVTICSVFGTCVKNVVELRIKEKTNVLTNIIVLLKKRGKQM